MHKCMMGQRYIEVLEADRRDFIRAQESSVLDNRKDKTNMDSSFLKNLGIIKVRGLPFKILDRDI